MNDTDIKKLAEANVWLVNPNTLLFFKTWIDNVREATGLYYKEIRPCSLLSEGIIVGVTWGEALQWFSMERLMGRDNSLV